MHFFLDILHPVCINVKKRKIHGLQTAFLRDLGIARKGRGRKVPKPTATPIKEEVATMATAKKKAAKKPAAKKPAKKAAPKKGAKKGKK